LKIVLRKYFHYLILSIAASVFCIKNTCAQYETPERVFEDVGTNLWVGSYNTFRIGEKWLWVGQHHYRRAGYNGVPYVGRMAQFYNRHAISYVYNKNLVVTLGGVLRLNFTPDPSDEDELVYKKLRLEPRIWHEYMFILPIDNLMFYHRIRIEHRWSIGNAVDADWIYRDRWRYKIYTNIPLNSKTMQPGTIYFTPDVEIIMQSGKSIVNSPLEDLRLYPQIGYVASPRIKYGLGMMYTTGQRTPNGHQYRQRWVLRLNMYMSLDFRKFESKITDINFTD
jgi:hypothetical protein